MIINKIKMPIACDLSFTSYLHAVDLAIENGVRDLSFVTLRIPIEQIFVALEFQKDFSDTRAKKHMRLENLYYIIDRTFGPDQWQLEFIEFKQDKETIVYSDGA